MSEEELSESELGTQEYWDKRYKQEIANFKNHGDPGEVWFGEDIVAKTISWIMQKLPIETNPKILDVGCGNGMLLIELGAEGYKNLHGVDYSEGAIVLAKSIAKEKDLVINYSVCDVLKGFNDFYDVVHDKGTYDAISLNKNAKEFRSQYVKSVCDSLNDGGFFIITSCNWTKVELDEHFKAFFVVFDVIPTPQFKFGGQTGSVVTSVIYTKKLK